MAQNSHIVECLGTFQGYVALGKPLESVRFFTVMWNRDGFSTTLGNYLFFSFVCQAE